MPDDDANADFIVRAVNSHDELVAFVKKMNKYIEKLATGHELNAVDYGCRGDSVSMTLADGFARFAKEYRAVAEEAAELIKKVSE